MYFTEQALAQLADGLGEMNEKYQQVYEGYRCTSRLISSRMRTRRPIGSSMSEWHRQRREAISRSGSA